MSSAVDIRGLSFRYRRAGEEALKEIDYSQRSGEAVAFAGKSGAGKSSLVRCLNRIIPCFFPGDFKGEVRLFGKDISGMRPFEMSDLVGTVLQDFESQLFSSQAELDVAFGPENQGLAREEIKRRVGEALSRVGISDYRGRDSSTLSGGQKQRLALASVLALNPRLLALDEVTTDLDPVGRDEVGAIVREFAARGVSLLLVAHEPEELRVADRIVLLEKGRVERQGPAAEIIGNVSMLETAGVRPPDAAALFSRLGYQERPVTVEQAVEILKKRNAGFSVSEIEKMKAGDNGSCMGGSSTVLRAENLSHVYPGGVGALKDVDFEVGEGEFLAVVGQNGSGKTTLVKHLNGLLRPTAGDVLFRGKSIRERSVSQLGRDIGFVFQNPDHQIFSSRVDEEISFGPRNHGLGEGEVKERVERSLELVGLEGSEGRDPFIMTKGERQRVAVASILAMDPGVLILDEPTTGLDYSEQLAVMDMLKELNRRGRTIIIITHTLWLAARYARRAVLMAGGGIIDQGPVRDVFAREENMRRASLTPPEILRIGKAFGFPTLTVDEFAGLAEGVG